MSHIICNYCGAEVSSQSIEAEDGHCPECGALIIMRSRNFEDEEENFEEEFEYEDEFEEEDEDLYYDEDEFDEERE